MSMFNQASDIPPSGETAWNIYIGPDISFIGFKPYLEIAF